MWIFNSEETALGEALEGMISAEPETYRRLDTKYGYGMFRRDLPPDRVRIIVDGGGGYGPMWAGFARPGLADAAVHGEFNSAPNAYVLYEMAKAVDAGKGVLFLCNHFMGDYLNNDMALELLEREGIRAKACYISDDVCSCIGEEKEARGGLHGIAQIAKLAWNCAARGDSLDQVFRLAQKGNDRLRSITMKVEDQGQILVGPGFSGEPPKETVPFESADQLVSLALEKLLAELEPYGPKEVFLCINRLRRMCFTEGFVVLRAAVRYLRERGIGVCGSSVGTYFDVFNSNGCMISLLAADEEMKACLGSVSGYDFTV